MKLLSVFKFIGSAAAIFVFIYAMIMLVACIISWPEPYSASDEAKAISAIISFIIMGFSLFYIYESEE